ncbi:MAG: spoVAD, partial [Clostridiales bacterium]|nr:spoVAD [Clostridiales bacterium]
MLQGHQTWVFENKPVIIGSAAVGGPFEAQGNLAKDFDLLHDDLWLGQDSYEKAEKKLLEQACETAIKKAMVKKEDIQFFMSGDLINQIISSSFTARTLGIPFVGIYGACSSSMEGLALASLMVDSRFAKLALAGTSSHNAACEKQYRYPTEYGGQKPPTAQWTVTGAGAAVVAENGEGPKVICATIGRVVDMGLSDPFNMGAAMAPAAVDTIEAHFRDMNIDPSQYDLITTGDLGRVGHSIAGDLLKKHGLDIPEERFTDCGMLIYKDTQPVMSG